MDEVLSLMGVVLLVLAPVPMILAIERRLLPVDNNDSPSHIWLNRLFLWLMLQMIIAHLLGMSGFLFGSAIVAIELFMCLLGLLLTFKTKVRLLPKPAISNLDLSEKVMLLLLVSIWIPVIAYYAIRPFSEHDTIAYHLPAIVTWMQTHRFIAYSQFANDAVNYYPYGWEALCSLFFILGKSDGYVLFCNCAAVILLGLSTFRLSKCIGAQQTVALCAVSLLLSMPIFLINVGSLHTDLPMTAFFITGLFFLLLIYQNNNPVWVGFLLADMGLICASKASGMAYAALLLAGCIFFLVFRLRFFRKSLSCSTAVMIPVGSGVFVATAGFWYAHNWQTIGNPFGFLQVQVGPLLIFPGPMDSEFIQQTSLAGLFHLTNLEHLQTLLLATHHNLSAPFIMLVVMFIASIIQFPCLRKRGYGIVIFFLIAASILYWHTPFSADNGLNQGKITLFIGDQMRFAFPTLAALSACAAILRIPARFNYLIPSLFCFSSLWALFYIGGMQFLFLSILLSMMLMILWKFFNQYVMSVLLLSCILLIFSMRKEGVEKELAGIFNVLAVIPDEEPIGYMLGYQAYPLFGPDWAQRVQFIHESRFPDNNAFYASLVDKRLRYLAVGPAMGIYNNAEEIEWIESDPRYVSVLGSNPKEEIVVYKLNASATTSSPAR